MELIKAYRGELWGIFCELFGEKLLQKIENVLYMSH